MVVSLIGGEDHEDDGDIFGGVGVVSAPGVVAHCVVSVVVGIILNLV